jgi:hypothetical protein
LSLRVSEFINNLSLQLEIAAAVAQLCEEFQEQIKKGEFRQIAIVMKDEEGIKAVEAWAESAGIWIEKDPRNADRRIFSI